MTVEYTKGKYTMTNDTYCTAALPSLTYAMKAQRVLSAAGLNSDIVKLDSSKTKHGCGYGVSFACGMTDSVKRALRSGGVSVKQYVSGGGELL